MVLRLCVQPGEGKHWIVPKRNEPLSANATIENSVIASTVLAAGYTSYARGFSRRTGHTAGLSAPAIFVKASARAGFWCACIGAATNWYYHYAFTKPIVDLSQIESTPFKLWEKTDKYTVDDGFLAGAGIGLVSGLVSTVLFRRAPISWFAKCVGMTNIGAFAGITASHSYFHYKGERQTAATALEEWKKRRNLEFHWIYWNKLLMSKLAPTWQGYVVFNGIFKANSLPEEALKTPEKYGIVGIAALAPVEEDRSDEAGAEKEPVEEYAGYYYKAYDHIKNLQNVDAEYTRGKILELIEEKTQLIEESQWIIAELSRRQHQYCHDDLPDEDERQRRQREIQLLEYTFNRLRNDAEQITRKIILWELALQQKAAWEAKIKDDVQAWTAPLVQIESDKHLPSRSIKEFVKFRDQLVKEVADFEAKEKTTSGTERKNVTSDLDDGRILLRAADRLIYDSENQIKRLEAVGAVQNVQSKEAEGEASKAKSKDSDSDKGTGSQDTETRPPKDDAEVQKVSEEEEKERPRRNLEASEVSKP